MRAGDAVVFGDAVGSNTTLSGLEVEAGAFRVGGDARFDAGSRNIVLTNPGNDFVGTVGLRGNSVSIADANVLGLGEVAADRLVAASGGALDLGHGVVAGAAEVRSNGAITQSGAFRVGGDARFDAGSGNIVLANAGNDFIGTVSLAGGAATIVDANALTLDAFDVATLSATSHGALQLGQGAVAGALTVASHGGSVGQSGALRVGGATAVDAQGGAIALDHVGNDFTGEVSLAGGSIVIRDANDLSLSVVRATRGSDVEVAAGGALTLPAGEIDVGTGSLRLAAGSGTLGTRGRLAGGDVHLSGADGILLGHDVDAAGALRLASGADITQTGGRIGAARLEAVAGGAARLAGANRIGSLGAFSASGIMLANAGTLAVTGPVEARGGHLQLSVTQGDLVIDGRMSAGDMRFDVAGGIAEGASGRLVARTLGGRAGGPVVLGDADRFIDNQVERIGDFTAREGFSMTNGRSLTLVALDGSDFTIDAGTARFYLAVDGDVRQDGTGWLYNGRGTWSATGGIGLPDSPIHVRDPDAQTVTALGSPPAYFYIVRQEDEVSLEPVVRAQVASHREVAHLDPGAWASDAPDHGVVEPGIRLPDDQAPTCDPQRRAPDCETLH